MATVDVSRRHTIGLTKPSLPQYTSPRPSTPPPSNSSQPPPPNTPTRHQTPPPFNRQASQQVFQALANRLHRLENISQGGIGVARKGEKLAKPLYCMAMTPLEDCCSPLYLMPPSWKSQPPFDMLQGYVEYDIRGSKILNILRKGTVCELCEK